MSNKDKTPDVMRFLLLIGLAMKGQADNRVGA